MRILTLFCFLCACAASRPSAPAPSGERAVQVCIVNDATAHVSNDVVNAAFSAVSREYADRLGILFIPHVWVSADFTPSGWPMDVAFALRELCPAEADVRFVFTNRF